MIAASQDLMSLAALCEFLQATPHRVERAAEKLKLTPALRIDGRPFYDSDQVEKLREVLTR